MLIQNGNYISIYVKEQCKLRLKFQLHTIKLLKHQEL